ncbi:hypothetical protein K6R05_16285 [Pantoea alfalfae]|nr:hypothetical protein [Pantoea alfalfae]QZX95278.1 hypothetical protein K6R05_16285 [Pantoea alfalfae]
MNTLADFASRDNKKYQQLNLITAHKTALKNSDMAYFTAATKRKIS